MTWQARAEQLTAEAAEIGTDAALISAAAWRAHVDPSATASLTAAARMLWATPESLLRGGGRPLPHDRELLARSDDLAADTGTLFNLARATFDQAAQALEHAVQAARAAAAASAAAKNGQESAAAASAMAEAQQQIADCECALEILQDTGSRLMQALACLQQVPDDLATTYEVVYGWIHRDPERVRKLPHSSEFFDGTDPRRAA